MAIPAPLIPPLPCSIKVTRTPLAGGASATITESRESPLRRIRRCTAHQTQSLGDQAGVLEVDNVGGYFDAWGSGDVLRIEVLRPQDAAYALLLEGFIGEPEQVPGLRPVLSLPVVGPNSVLDLIKLTAKHDYPGEAYTDMFDDLCTTYLAGYTRTITADAATGSLKFQEGMKLREALDLIRRALIAATEPAKWEYIASKNGATRTITLFKRGSTSQATLQYREAMPGTRHWKGSAFHVINKATVLGATVPSQVTDTTSLTSAGQVILDATTDIAAQPFIALDTPLYSHTLYGDRSGGKDPPSLAGSVARNSDNLDKLGNMIPSYATRFLRTATNTPTGQPFTGSFANLKDQSDTTSVSQNMLGGDGAIVDKEWFVIDLGAPRTFNATYRRQNGFAGQYNTKVWGSLDDAAWTQLGTTLGTGGGSYLIAHDIMGSPVSYRYIKVTCSSNAAANSALTMPEFWVMAYDNEASPAPTNATDLVLPPGFKQAGNTSISTTGNSTKELARFDMASAQAVAKVILQHSESSTLSTITLNLQKSDDGTNWEDIAVLAATTSTVIDNLYLDEPDFQYLRVAVVDTRAGGSAAVTVDAMQFNVYFQTTTWGSPLAGDSMRGSAWSWDVTAMVAHPALFEETTWPAPRLAVIAGRYYWFLYKPQTGASNVSYWALDYATDPAILQFVLNGGMEDYPASTGLPNDWTNSGTMLAASITRETTNIQAGPYSIKAVGDGVRTMLFTQTLAGLAVGVEYLAEAYLRTGTVDYFGRLRVWNVTDGVEVGHYDQSQSNVATWERAVVKWTPASGKTYRIDLKGTLDIPANTVIHYFDSARVYPSDTTPGEAIVSVNSGSTWTAIDSQATLKHLSAFNKHELIGEAEDAASQAVYANFVPGGVLHGGIQDDSLITQDMVDREAEALVAMNKATHRRLQVVIALRPSLVPGQPVTLAQDWLLPLGVSGDFDVLEAAHEAVPGGRTALVLNRHPPLQAQALQGALTYATRRSI